MGTERQRVLFLHGGPGLSCAIEREWFSERLPIHWWDQPAVADAAAPFAALVDAAATQLKELSRTGPSHVIAHSFAGQIAYALARDYPELIGRITLLGSSPDAMGAFLRVCRRFAETDGMTSIHNLLAATANTHTEGILADLMAAIAGAPSFPALYFAPGSAISQRFTELLAKVGHLDLATLTRVMSEFFDAAPLTPLPQYAGEITLVTGRYDPAFDEDNDVVEWQRIFPQLRTIHLDTGHFIHLEAPPEAWFSRHAGIPATPP